MGDTNGQKKVDKLLNSIKEVRNFTDSDNFPAAMKDFAKAVRFHESGDDYKKRQVSIEKTKIDNGRAGMLDPRDKSEKSWIGSVQPAGSYKSFGGGAYQYEMDSFTSKGSTTGLDGTSIILSENRLGRHGGTTAIRSAKNYLEALGLKEHNKWLDPLIKEGNVDFSNLKNWQQDIIFIAEKANSTIPLSGPDTSTSLRRIVNAYNLKDKNVRDKEYAKIWGQGHKKVGWKDDLINEKLRQPRLESALIDNWIKEDNPFA